jgi:endonuclease III
MGLAVEDIGTRTPQLTDNDGVGVMPDTSNVSIIGVPDAHVINSDTIVTANKVPVDSSITKESTKSVTSKPTTAGITRRQTRASTTAAIKQLTYALQSTGPPAPLPKKGSNTTAKRLESAMTKSEELAKKVIPTPSLPRPVTGHSRNASQTQDTEAAADETQKPIAALIDQKMKVKRGTANKYGLTRGTTPYPHRHAIPSKDQCEEVHRLLTEMHGEVKQPTKAPAPSLDVAGCGEVPSVLDALLRTLISGNTLMANADAAVKRLVETYGILAEGVGAGSINWNAVRVSSLEKLINVVRPAGCPKLKGGHIKAILDMVYEEQKARAQAHLDNKPVPGGQNEDQSQKALEIEKVAEDYLSLDHMHAMTADEAITEFVSYPGIGVKTAACVVLFCLRIPCFAVDTHVHKFCVWLGWVPEKANELDTFNHAEFTVPDHLKYGLHQLFIRHGQQCFKCRKNTRPGTKAWDNALECPLEHLLDRTKGNFGRAEKEDDVEERGKATGADDATVATKKKATEPKRIEEAAEKGPEGDDAAEVYKEKIIKASKRGAKARSAKDAVKGEHGASGEDTETEAIAPKVPKKELAKLHSKTGGKKATAEKAASKKTAARETAAKKTASKLVAQAVNADEDKAVDDAQGAAGKNFKVVSRTVAEQEVGRKIKSEVSKYAMCDVDALANE